MKLAVLAFLSLDARAGVIPEPALRPFGEVLGEFKHRVAKNELPADIVEAGLNQMEIWTKSAGRVKSHRFDLAQVTRGEATSVHRTAAALAEVPVLEVDSATDAESSAGAEPTPAAASDIQPEGVPGLSPAEPGEETPQADADSTDDEPDIAPDIEPDSLSSPPAGGRKGSKKG